MSQNNLIPNFLSDLFERYWKVTKHTDVANIKMKNDVLLCHWTLVVGVGEDFTIRYDTYQDTMQYIMKIEKNNEKNIAMIAILTDFSTAPNFVLSALNSKWWG